MLPEVFISWSSEVDSSTLVADVVILYNKYLLQMRVYRLDRTISFTEEVF